MRVSSDDLGSLARNLRSRFFGCIEGIKVFECFELLRVCVCWGPWPLWLEELPYTVACQVLSYL